jgi:hypothetical protein
LALVFHHNQINFKGFKIMYNVLFKNKLSAASAIGLLALSLGVSLPAAAGIVKYGDPTPADPLLYPSCAINGTSSGHDGGISYEWIVTMGKKDEVSFVNHVGAKSWNEPESSGYFSPETGWTHTSNWVALELTGRTKLHIEVEQQEGVPFTNGSSIATARNKLIPALSIYKGWDDTSCEDHRYNTGGNFDWSTIEYIGNQPNAKGKSVAVYSVKLDAGKYSIAIGGSPAVLGVYPDGNCDANDPVCYAYTGRHGYRVEMKTDN